MLLILLAVLLLQDLHQHFPATLAGGETPSTGLVRTERGSTEVHYEVIGLPGIIRDEHRALEKPRDLDLD